MPPQLDQLVPDADTLLAMSEEDLGHVLLKVAKSQLQKWHVLPRRRRQGDIWREHGGLPASSVSGTRA